jgi:hypothetical protein
MGIAAGINGERFEHCEEKADPLQQAESPNKIVGEVAHPVGA